jgi:hypothetical protein
VGFIVTNLETDSRAVVRFCNKRGTAEQWIKDGLPEGSSGEATSMGLRVRTGPASRLRPMSLFCDHATRPSPRSLN